MFLLKLSFRTVKTLLNFFFCFFFESWNYRLSIFYSNGFNSINVLFQLGSRNQYKYCFWGGGLIFITDISRCTSWWLARSFKTFWVSKNTSHSRWFPWLPGGNAVCQRTGKQSSWQIQTVTLTLITRMEEKNKLQCLRWSLCYLLLHSFRLGLQEGLSHCF